MLRITILEETHGVRVKLEGRLVADWVEEAHRVWFELREAGREVIVDLFGMTFADELGSELLRMMYFSGVQMEGRGPMVLGLIEEQLAPVSIWPRT